MDTYRVSEGVELRPEHMHRVPKNPLQVLVEILEACEPEDSAPVTWGSLRRTVGQAAREWEV